MPIIKYDILVFIGYTYTTAEVYQCSETMIKFVSAINIHTINKVYILKVWTWVILGKKNLPWS